VFIPLTYANKKIALSKWVMRVGRPEVTMNTMNGSKGRRPKRTRRIAIKLDPMKVYNLTTVKKGTIRKFRSHQCPKAFSGDGSVINGSVL